MDDQSALILLIQQYAAKFGMTFNSKAMDREESRQRAAVLMMQAIAGQRGPVTDKDLEP